MPPLSNMTKESAWLNVGTIVSPQGLEGKIRLNPASDFPERFTVPGNRWLQKDEESPRKVKLVSGHQIPGKSIFIVKFSGINDRNSAELLVGHKMLVRESDRPKMTKNEFHFLDLLGLEARLSNLSSSIGEVTNLTTGGNELLEIKLLDGKKVLIPFVKEIIPEVNIKEGWLLLNPPPGLLDL